MYRRAAGGFEPIVRSSVAVAFSLETLVQSIGENIFAFLTPSGPLTNDSKTPTILAQYKRFGQTEELAAVFCTFAGSELSEHDKDKEQYTPEEYRQGFATDNNSE